MALNKVQQLVRDSHELFFFVPLEMVSITNLLGQKLASWLVRLTDWTSLQMTTNCSQLNILQ